jgi:hypothetical protein
MKFIFLLFFFSFNLFAGSKIFPDASIVTIKKDQKITVNIRAYNDRTMGPVHIKWIAKVLQSEAVTAKVKFSLNLPENELEIVGKKVGIYSVRVGSKTRNLNSTGGKLTYELAHTGFCEIKVNVIP